MKAGDRVTLEQLNVEHIRLVLEATDEMGDAAKWLGFDRGTLRRWIYEHQIHYLKRPRRRPSKANSAPGDKNWNYLPPREDDAEGSTDD